MAESMSLVSFKIADELYGIDIMDVVEIIKMTEITPIPNSPSFIDGVINLRGEIIPVVDLKKRFNFKIEKRELSEEELMLQGIIIIFVNDIKLGILIDQPHKVLTVSKEEIKAPPQAVASIGREYIQGVIQIHEENLLLILLNVKKLFSKRELLQMAT